MFILCRSNTAIHRLPEAAAREFPRVKHVGDRSELVRVADRGLAQVVRVVHHAVVGL